MLGRGCEDDTIAIVIISTITTIVNVVKYDSGTNRDEWGMKWKKATETY